MPWQNLTDGAGSYDFSTSYNLDHTVQSRTFPAAGGLPAEGINYTYDELRRPTSVFGAVAYASQIDYYPTGQLAQVGLFAGATDAWQSFEYEDGTNRLARSFTNVEGVAGTVADVGYSYDPAGNLTSIIDDPGAAGGQRDAQCFEYDHLRRLTTAWTSATAGGGDTACAGGPEASGVAGPAPYWHDYGFDVVGNRTTLTEHATGGSGADVTTTYSYPSVGQRSRTPSRRRSPATAPGTPTTTTRWETPPRSTGTGRWRPSPGVRRATWTRSTSRVRSPSSSTTPKATGCYATTRTG